MAAVRRGLERGGFVEGRNVAIVVRSRRFWLLIDDSVIAAAKVQIGDVVNVAVAPLK